MRKLYKFHWDCGRHGEVKCFFIEDDAVVKKCLGVRVYFGEILGKHSEIFGKLEEHDLEVLTDDQNVIDIIEKYIGKSFGHNPLNYLRADDGDELPEDFWDTKIADS